MITLSSAEIGRLLKQALRILGHREDAEDAVQITMVKLLEQRDTIDQARSTSWINRVLHNVCCDMIRSRCRARKHESPIFPVDTLRSPDSTPLDQLCEQEYSQEVYSALSHLRDPYRKTFVSVCLLEQSYDECAARERVPVGTVKSRVHFAKEELRKSLDHGSVAS